MRNIFILYFEWHFIDGPKSILLGWRNCLRFNLDYWSVPLLLKTLFSHWRRYQYSYGRGFSFGKYFEAFTFNVLSRFLGALMRSVLIAFGFLTEIFIFLAGAFVLILWLCLPFFIVGGFIYGLKLLF